MKIVVTPDAQQLGQAAAKLGAKLICQAISRNGHATIVVATGVSQFELYKALTQADVPWQRVTVFHLDEYVGMPVTHPASFRLYLWRRFVSQLPLPLAGFHPINGETDPVAECRRLGRLIRQAVIDVALVGIGENGHLAFNDPPANFREKKPYVVVKLDETCRRQQMGEGWFKTLRDVPTQAISMSIPQIMAAKAIVCSVPDLRKAPAVRDCLPGPVTPMHPASILQKHPACTVYLDTASASLLPACPACGKARAGRGK